MAWVESISPSFRARHESGESAAVGRALDSLERTRERLDGLFGSTPGEVTVVFHARPATLSLAHPLLPLWRRATEPAGRRYVAGWAGASEVHVLSPAALERRASGAPESRAMLARVPDSLYARLVIAAHNRALPPPHTPRRLARALRWAWLVEGAARFLGGETEHARPAIGRRLREGPRPEFPPAARDAALLGGTVIDLLAREEGLAAAVEFTRRLDSRGPRPALTAAFGGRALVHTDGAWRSHLARLAGG